jgi:hypothetical protein
MISSGDMITWLASEKYPRSVTESCRPMIGRSALAAMTCNVFAMVT